MKRSFTLILIVFLSSSLYAKKPKSSPAAFPDGDFAEWVYGQMTFPESAKKDNLTGILTADIYINDSGVVYRAEVKVNNTPHVSISEEFERIVYDSPQWAPATENKNKVRSVQTVEIDAGRLLSPEEVEAFTVVDSHKAPVYMKDKGATLKYFIKWLDEQFGAPSDDSSIFTEIAAIGFAVDENGFITDISIPGDVPDSLAAVIDEVMSRSPQWSRPALINGEPHSYHREIPLYHNDHAITATLPESMIQPPLFLGVDYNYFKRWFMENLRYPKDALSITKPVKIVTRFTVERDGWIDNIRVVEGGDNAFSREIVNLLSNSPQWIPGYNNGKTVRVDYTIPIVFNPPREMYNSTKTTYQKRPAGPTSPNGRY